MYRELSFGYRQDTKEADHADQKPIFGVNCLFCNKEILAKKVSSQPFLELRSPFKYPYRYNLRGILVSKLGSPSLLIVWTEKPNASKDKAATKASINWIGFSEEIVSSKLQTHLVARYSYDMFYY